MLIGAYGNRSYGPCLLGSPNVQLRGDSLYLVSERDPPIRKANEFALCFKSFLIILDIRHDERDADYAKVVSPEVV
jgi:hypothetical protein